MGTCRRITDCARQSPRPPRHLQETHRQSATMPRPSLYLKETHIRCKTVTQTVGAPAGDSKTVCDVGQNVWAPAGDSHTVPDNIHDRLCTSRRIPDSL
ncbi:hypothetical protein DPMN_125608 [Dreissena polymorpha]|uniref:Uncharacterized protein n=1 Tax=Dreissena polymorpha TaxID=45954 RepID=A0A9D4GU98_DREPO|nr:hypothetical protein DPMN_125608 [Dreissena polymorpha]